MRRAFSTLGCPDYDILQVASLAAAHRFDAVELRALGGTMDLPGYFERTYGQPAVLAEVVQWFPLDVSVLGTSFRLIGCRESDREAFLRYVPWAEALGVAFLRVFDGGKCGDADEIEKGLETFAWWRNWRLQNGVKVEMLVETHDALVSAEALQRFLTAAPACRLLWDAHHTWRLGKQDLGFTWALAKRNTAHIHVKDSIGDPASRMGYRYVLPGTGQFPMNELRALLIKDQYHGVLSLEWEKAWHSELPLLEEALTAAERAAWW